MPSRPWVRLAPIRERDAKPFLAAARASHEFHRPWVYPPATAAEFRRFVRGCGAARQRFALWGTEAKSGSPPLLGYFSLSEIVRGNLNSAYLGYWVARPYARQGVMTDGLELVLRVAFRKLRLHRVEANIQPGNTASIQLAGRAGFRLEGLSQRYLKVGGRWRDHERHAMTLEDWQSRPARAPARVRPLAGS